MGLTVNAKSYATDAVSANNVGYVGPAKTMSIKDDINLKRIAPSPTALYSGNSQVSAKLQRTHTLTGALTATGNSTFELRGVFPVGMPQADIDTICADLGAWLASAEAKTVFKTPKVNV